MRKMLVFVLSLCMLLCLSAPAFAGARNSGMTKLSGEYAAAENVRYDRAAMVEPFYPDRPVENCEWVTLSLAVEPKSGWCGGNFYLYLKDPEGNWEHWATFRLEEDRMDGAAYIYRLALDGRTSFVAAALWPADKMMDFEAVFEYTLFVDPACVGEYGGELPAPSYEKAEGERHTLATHVSAEAYSNPWPWGISALG